MTPLSERKELRLLAKNRTHKRTHTGVVVVVVVVLLMLLLM